TALAQPFPSRAVKIVVPTTPGGATDALSRSIGARLSEIWNQPVIVENRPGATQIIGGEYVAKSPPDGYTLIVSDAATFIMNPILHKTLPYDGLRAFTPIPLLARAGKLRLIAAATPKRIAKLPDLPTVAESGVPGYEAGTWFALAGPAGMSREVTYAIYNEVKKVLNEPAFREKYIEKQWFEVVANNPDEFAEFLQTDY